MPYTILYYCLLMLFSYTILYYRMEGLQDRRRDVQPLSHDVSTTGGLQHGPRVTQKGRNTDRKGPSGTRCDVQQPSLLLQVM
jgi:hypothetical protein